jgi:hypothetical protein
MLEEINSLKALFDKAAQAPVDGSLVVLDIDQTLLRCASHWGSEPWYEWVVRQNTQAGLGEVAAILAANAEWEKAGQVVDFVPVEKAAPTWLSEWQKHGHVMGLTARHIRIAGRTTEHLRGNGFVLTGAQECQARLDLGELGVYENGVMYVGPVGEKGPALAELVRRLPRRPERIYFADDKSHHVLSVRKILGAMGIEVFAARFSAADTMAADFDPVHAAKELAAGKALKR